jgi:ferritin-like metal-binding protein YciE
MANINISMNDEVRGVLKESAKRMGISQSAYISQLIMQKELEWQMSKFMKNLTPEQIQKALKEQGGSD